MKIRLANNHEYEVLYSGNSMTRVEPSDNPHYRAKIYIYLPEAAMELVDFINEFSNKENLKSITFIGETFENTYENFTNAVAVGLERVEEVNGRTGEVISYNRLAARLEQLTATEQQLEALGLL